MFLHHDELTPAALRMGLSPVFTRLREGSQAAQPVGSQENVVDRLHKLADLLDRGLLTDDEFARLKSELLS